MRSTIKSPRGVSDITDAMVSTIKGMIARGDRQTDVAQWWGLPVTHVSNIATGKRGRSVPRAPLETLPPQGPYQIVSVEVHAKLQEAAAVPLKTLQEIMSLLRGLQKSIDKMQRHEETVHGEVHVDVTPREFTGSPHQMHLPFKISARQ